MFDHLQIYNPRERMMVGCADLVLGVCAGAMRLVTGRPRRSVPPRRILLLRLERIGDFLMTLRAFESVRARAPEAHIHLVIASWNRPLASLLQGINSVETINVPWLVRHGTGASMAQLIRRANAWQDQNFDLAINFEPDIRTNVLMNLSGAPVRVGFSSGGGGALLTDAVEYLPDSHVSANAMRLVNLALPDSSHALVQPFARLQISEAAREEASRLLEMKGSSDQMLIGVHASGGRRVKEWDLARLAEVATRLAREWGATIVLTGTAEDRTQVQNVSAALPSDVKWIDVSGALDLTVFAALLERLSLLLVGDTGPMHLAAAVGTPLVTLFGPSDPNRYGPLSDRARVVTANLWCRPCNRVRRPPDRCVGHVPDCLNQIDVEMVVAAARDLVKT